MDSERRRLERLAQEGNIDALIQWNQLRQREGYPPYLPAVSAHIKMLEQELLRLKKCVNKDNIRQVLAETFSQFLQKHQEVIPRVFWSCVWQYQSIGAPIVNSLVFEEVEPWYRNIMGSAGRWINGQDQPDVNWGREYQAGDGTPDYASTSKLLALVEQKLNVFDEKQDQQEFNRWNSLKVALIEFEAILQTMQSIRIAGAIGSYLQKFFPSNTAERANEVSQEIRDLRRSNSIFNLYLLPDRIVVEQRSHMQPPVFEPRILEVTLYQDL